MMNFFYIKNMQQLKDILSFLDIVVGTFWGFTVMEVIPLVTSGTTIVFTQVDNAIKILFALVGLIYTIVRLIHFYKISKLNREFRKQEVIEKENANFYHKWDKEFLQPKK